MRKDKGRGLAQNQDGSGLGRGGTLTKDMEKGRKLVLDLGCTGCHEIGNLPVIYNGPELDGIGDKSVDELAFGNIQDVEKTLINWMKIKLTGPERFATDTIITKMPHMWLDEKQAEAVITFLLSVQDNPVSQKYRKTLIAPDKVEMRGKRVLEKYNCTGCHKINEKGGDIGPDLTKEARKSRPEWLFNFLKNPHKIRPVSILKAKMPNFELSDKEINNMVEYLSYVSGDSYPYNLEVKKKIHVDDIRTGEKLYHEIFACSGCHVVNRSGGEIGPEHTDLASRLKRDWIEEWLINPQAMKPDVRMPRFRFKGWEFEALTNYLMTLGKYRHLQIKEEN